MMLKAVGRTLINTIKRDEFREVCSKLYETAPLLGGFNWSLQHQVVELILAVR